MSEIGAKNIQDIGKILGSMMGLCVAVWFFGEPFLEDYVESHIEAYEIKHAEEVSGKKKLRSLLANEMGCDTDEVHIELGRMYKEEKSVHAEIDSVEKAVKREVKNLKLIFSDESTSSKFDRRKMSNDIVKIKNKIKLD